MCEIEESEDRKRMRTGELGKQREWVKQEGIEENSQPVYGRGSFMSGRKYY